METLTDMEKETYIKSILQNDEVSTNRELVNLFMSELSIKETEAGFYVEQRNEALNNMNFELDNEATK